MLPKICSFPDCVRKLYARSVCHAHYQQIMRGAPLAPLAGSTLTHSQRFWQKVNKTAECWTWIGAKNDKGYGSLWGSGKVESAHRVSYRFANGSIPEGAQVDHMCHNRACVKPEHLRLVSNKQNNENRAGAQKNSGTGIRGVSWNKDRNKWRAQVQHNGQKVYIGLFESLDGAESAVIAKRNELFTHNLLDRFSA